MRSNRYSEWMIAIVVAMPPAIACGEGAANQPKIIIIDDGTRSTIGLSEIPAVPGVPHFSRSAAIELFEDETNWFAKQLIQAGFNAEALGEHDDCYSGVGSLKITGQQRFHETIKGWNYPIADKPGPGEYRYIRFAWKKIGGTGIMMQLHDRHANSWERRYVAGPNSVGFPAISVAAKAPEEWTVVTRDLYADFGAFTLTGIALTPMDGEAGLFDHIYLGKSIEDLDKITTAVREQPRRKNKLAKDNLDQCWKSLLSLDAASAQPAISHLVSAHADALPYIKQRMTEVERAETSAEVQALIADLDHQRFAVRDAAFRKLEGMGAAVVEALKSALAKSKSMELSTRIEKLLAQPALRDADWSPRELRLLRIMRVLEQIETAEARDVLKALPLEATAADLKTEGKLALDRMEKRPRLK